MYVWNIYVYHLSFRFHYVKYVLNVTEIQLLKTIRKYLKLHFGGNCKICDCNLQLLLCCSCKDF